MNPEDLDDHKELPAGQTCFFTLIDSQRGARNAALLIESLRSFGGSLSQSPFWVFSAQPQHTSRLFAGPNILTFPLEVESSCQSYIFTAKVHACAQAESLAAGKVQSLVWLSTDSLIVNPPTLFSLNTAYDAAFRTVHIRNIGSPAQEPLDSFWEAVYQTVGLDKAPFAVESFVDEQVIRPYFNSHCFAIDPSLGLCHLWLERFKEMVSDQAFQSGPCADELHQVFLHQAILSTLVAKHLPKEQIRFLPLEYSYPLHFHHQVPAQSRPLLLNDLVCAVYEGYLEGGEIAVQEPLRSWLDNPTRSI